ncbi:MAG: hypothetical protein K2P83_03080 [Nitrosomonas sp.]|nr:hypothetical protein [Nitrosomonas sp.]
MIGIRSQAEAVAADTKVRNVFLYVPLGIAAKSQQCGFTRLYFECKSASHSISAIENCLASFSWVKQTTKSSAYRISFARPLQLLAKCLSSHTQVLISLARSQTGDFARCDYAQRARFAIVLGDIFRRGGGDRHPVALVG